MIWNEKDLVRPQKKTGHLSKVDLTANLYVALGPKKKLDCLPTIQF